MAGAGGQGQEDDLSLYLDAQQVLLLLLDCNNILHSNVVQFGYSLFMISCFVNTQQVSGPEI